MKRILYIAVAAGLLCTAACSNDGCLDNQSSIPLAGVYSSETGNPVSINGIQIMGVGAPNDSLLVASGAVQQVYLPMRSTASTTEWRFHYTQAGIDDESFDDYVSFTYTSQPYFASEECGAMYRYHITDVKYTTNLLDSVVVTDSLITNADIERIRLYFRTYTPEPDPDEGEEGGEDTPTPDEGGENPDTPQQ